MPYKLTSTDFGPQEIQNVFQSIKRRSDIVLKDVRSQYELFRFRKDGEPYIGYTSGKLTHPDSKTSQKFIKELQETIKVQGKGSDIGSQRMTRTPSKYPRTIRIEKNLVPLLSNFLVDQGGVYCSTKDRNIYAQIEYNGVKATLYNSGAIVSSSFDILRETLRTFLETTPTSVGGIVIGQDEAGKGEWFGPMTVGSVALDTNAAIDLQLLGVTDSKHLQPQAISVLFREIKRLVPALRVVEIHPRRFNTLYAEFGDEGKTLNDLLAWGHKSALEGVITQLKEKGVKIDKVKVTIDEFDRLKTEKRLISLIKQNSLILVQQHKADQSVLAVGAASIAAKAIQQDIIRKYETKIGMEASQIDPVKFISSPQALLYSKLSFLQKLARTKMSQKPPPEPPFLIEAGLNTAQIADRIMKIAQGGETNVVEFKASLPRNASDISKELTAFANTFGGIILVGVNDIGQICGTQYTTKDQERIASIAASKKCDPPISPRFLDIEYKSQEILIVEIDRSLYAHQSDGKYYLRYGNTCQVASHSIVEHLMAEKAKLIKKKES